MEGLLLAGQLAEVEVAGQGVGLWLDNVLWARREKQEFVALVDAGNAFDPASVQEPALLEHLLWVRCKGVRQALHCADALLRDDNFPLVIVDLLEAPLRELKRVPLHQWYRLQHLCRAGGAGVLLTRGVHIPAAQHRLRLGGRFSLGDLERARDELCSGLQVEVLKQKSGTEGLKLIGRDGALLAG